MALKDIFKMTKANRYTADGREELIKAQEAETEDRRYNIGEISEKTGLQKTANGWAKPKNGKQPGVKKENSARTFEFKSGPDGMPVAGSGKEVKTYKTKKEAQEALKKQNAAAGLLPAAENKTTIRQGPNTKTLNETPAEHIKKNWDYYAEPGRYGQEDMEQLVLSPSGYKETGSYSVMGGGKRVQYEKEGGEKIALFLDKDGELDDYEIEGPGSKPSEKTGYEKLSIYELQDKFNSNDGKVLNGEMKEEHEKVKKELEKRTSENKPTSKGYKKGDTVFDRYGERSEVIATSDDYVYVKNSRGRKEWKSEDAFAGKKNSEATDSAPHVLTGDTRIRVRKYHADTDCRHPNPSKNSS